MWAKLKRADFMYYVSLVFLFFPIVNVVAGNAPPSTLAYTGLFLIAYLGLVITDTPWIIGLLWAVIWCYVLGAVFWLNANYIWFVFYLVNLAVYGLNQTKLTNPYNLSILGLMVLSVGGYAWRQASPDELFMLIGICFFILSIGYGQFMSYQKFQRDQHILEQNKQINLLLAENERHRIRRDLHDNLGHLFATMSVKSELATKLLDRGQYETVRRELGDLNALTRQSMQEVREIVNGLNIRSLDTELQRIVDMLKIAGVTLTVDNQLQKVPLLPVLESTIGLCLLEAANNIVKHAQAQKAHIQIRLVDHQIEIIVEDDGVGFEELSGQELHTIRERLRLVSGDVIIQSAKQPTRVCLTLAYQEG